MKFKDKFRLFLKSHPLFYPIIDDAFLNKEKMVKTAETILSAGAEILQIRAKNSQSSLFLQIAEEILSLNFFKNTEQSPFLIINDRIDVAMIAGAHGVHLGQEDIPADKAKELLGGDKIIGLSVHNLQEALLAEKKQVDYLSIGPIFPTSTKETGRKPFGLKIFSELKPHLSLPLFGIGGITLENMESVIKAGADGVAVISSLLKAKDIFTQTKKFLEKINSLC